MEKFYHRLGDERFECVVNYSFNQYKKDVELAYSFYDLADGWIRHPTYNGYLIASEDQCRVINTIYSLSNREPPDMNRISHDDILNIEITMMKTLKPEVQVWRDVDL